MTYLHTTHPGAVPLDPFTFTPDRPPTNRAPNHPGMVKMTKVARVLSMARECDPWSHERPARRTTNKGTSR